MISAALTLDRGKCPATERHPSAVKSGRSAPLKGSKVHAIQNRMAAGGVARIKNSGPSRERTSSTMGLLLSAAQVVSFSAEDPFDMPTLVTGHFFARSTRWVKES